MIDRYSRKELRALWSDQRRYDTWLDVELAACAAMEREGTVPAGTAARVRRRALAAPRDDLVRRARHLAGGAAGRRHRRDPGRARPADGGAAPARRGAP